MMAWGDEEGASGPKCGVDEWMLAVTLLLWKTLQSASSPSTVRALRAGTVLEENRKQRCKCIPCAQHCVSIQPVGHVYAQAPHWGVRWHPTNSVKAKSPTALSPLVSVCVGYSCSLMSFSNWSRVPEGSVWPQEHYLLPSPAPNLLSLYQAWHLVLFLPVPGVAKSGLLLIHSVSSWIMAPELLVPVLQGHREVLPCALGS